MIEKAIDILHDIMAEGFTVGDRIFDVEQDESDAIQIAILALEELQQYRKIGTVDGYRAARKKMKPLSPLLNDNGIYYCPICEREAKFKYDLHCSGCGQALKWW